MHRTLPILIIACAVSACSTVSIERSKPATKGASTVAPTPYQSAYEVEKTALDIATAEGTSAALDRFIESHPQSSWIPTAVYRRDRVALEEAKRIGTAEAFQIFLQKYPQSDWGDQARYFLQYGVPKEPEGHTKL